MQDATAQTGTQLSGENLSCLPEAYSLEELVDCVSGYMPDKGSEGFVTPTLTVQNEWRTLVRDMLAITDISQCSTIDLPASLEDIYDVFHFTDAYNGRQYCVALEVKSQLPPPLVVVVDSY